MKNLSIPLLIAVIFFFSNNASSVLAESRGIGVSPSEIILSNDKDYPKTVNLTVKNFSQLDEWVEVYFSENLLSFALAESGRFILPPQKTGRVSIIFDKPAELNADEKSKGTIRVSAVRTSSEGFSTGAGVEIPVIWENQNASFNNSLNQSALLANVRNAFSGAFGEWPVKIAFLIIIAVLLGRLSRFLTKEWQVNYGNRK